MPVTQQQPIFTADESERFAVLWAGFDVCNSNDAEAKNKGNALRRMMAGKKFEDGRDVRLVDAFELDEIRAALDDQMQPARQPLANAADVAVLEEKLQNLEEQLGDAFNKNEILTDALARLQGRSQQNGSFTGPVLSCVMALALAAECVLAVAGLFGSRSTPLAAAPAPLSAALPSVARATPEQSAVTITTESRSYMVTPSGRVFIRAPETKAKPVRVVVVPEVEMPLPGVRVVVKPESKF
jgi:hypothetical protein